MTQAKPRFATFEEYLAYSSELEGRFQLIDGELIELPPESRFNSTIAIYILLALIKAGLSVELIHPGKCEIQVPVLKKGDAQNRFPDLVVLREEHLQLTQRRLTITLDMPPPHLVVEVVSPGKTNRALLCRYRKGRDYINKRAQYAAIGVDEYWIVDPATQTVLVLELAGEEYKEVGQFQEGNRIVSIAFPNLTLMVEQIFQTEM
jgi:Uma2 family endonuclease